MGKKKTKLQQMLRGDLSELDTAGPAIVADALRGKFTERVRPGLERLRDTPDLSLRDQGFIAGLAVCVAENLPDNAGAPLEDLLMGRPLLPPAGFMTDFAGWLRWVINDPMDGRRLADLLLLRSLVKKAAVTDEQRWQGTYEAFIAVMRLAIRHPLPPLESPEDVVLQVLQEAVRSNDWLETEGFVDLGYLINESESRRPEGLWKLEWEIAVAVALDAIVDHQMADVIGDNWRLTSRGKVALELDKPLDLPYLVPLS